MIKDVLININATLGPDEKSDVMDLTTEAKFGIKNDEYFISYDESEILGIKDVKTSIFIKKDDSVILQRKGGLESRLIIQQGQRNLCQYCIPQGEIMLGIFGETIKCEVTPSGGNIELIYTIDSDLKFVSRNRINISISGVDLNVDNCSKS